MDYPLDEAAGLENEERAQAQSSSVDENHAAVAVLSPGLSDNHAPLPIETAPPASVAAAAYYPVEGVAMASASAQAESPRNRGRGRRYQERWDDEGEEAKQEISAAAYSFQHEETKEEIISDLASTQMGTFATEANSDPYTVAAAVMDQDCVYIPAEREEDDDDLAALKRTAYMGRGGLGDGVQENFNSAGASRLPEYNSLQATVVEIASAGSHRHYRDPLSPDHNEAVQAELIGQDFSSMATLSSEISGRAPVADELQQQQSAAETGEVTTEATVIDSEPLLDANQSGDQTMEDAPSWKVNGEAQVLVSDENAVSSFAADASKVEEESAADATSTDDMTASSVRITDTPVATAAPADHEFAVADREAEVVGIQEEVHPDEFEHDAEAELVGTGAAHATVEGVAVAEGAAGHQDAAAAEVVAVQENVHPYEYVDGTNAAAELVGTAEATAEGVAVAQHNSLQPSVADSAVVDHHEAAAEVVAVEENVHPYEYADSMNAEAELVGTAASTVEGVAVAQHHSLQTSAADCAVAYHQEAATEVIAVQDNIHPHEYVDGANAEAGLVGTAEAAVAGVAVAQHHSQQTSVTDSAVVDHQGAAEVVAVEENVHPYEYVDRVNAEAELVGAATATFGGVAVAQHHLQHTISDSSADVLAVQETVHPHESVNGSGTEAEFIGTAEAAVEGVAVSQHHLQVNLHDSAADAVAVQENVHPYEFVDRSNAEAEIVGSAEAVLEGVAVAQHHLEVDSVAVGHHETAEVVAVEENVHPHEYVDSDNAEAELVGTAVAQHLSCDEQQAEVLDIQEDVHPGDMVRNAAEAELVGAVAGTPSQDQGADAPVAGQATVMENLSSGAAGASETLRSPSTVSAAVLPAVASPETTGEEAWPRKPPPASQSATPLRSDTEQSAPAVAAAVLPAVATPETTGEAWPRKAPPASQSATPLGSDSAQSAPAVAAAVLPAVATPDATGEEAWPQKPPPASQSATPLGHDADDDSDHRPDWLRETPPQQPFASSGREISSTSETSGGTASSQRHVQMISSTIARGTTNVMEALFGDAMPPMVPGRRGRASAADIASKVVPRKLLPWSVIYSPPTKMWVATLQTNQKALDKNNISEASKSLRAFSLPTEKSAVALAKAWTPPRMLAFTKKQVCHLCSSKFALLRRPCHCRNCGVVLCKDCSVPWPAKMIPDTYNFKKEGVVNVCQSCDWLSNSFRLALLEGNQDKAVAIEATGNINLHAPFANVKGELFYPVHCAALGGSLDLLQWLVDENCCPIKSLRVSGAREAGGTYTPIVTSRGRSLLGIAMESRNVAMIRYLVVHKGISLAGEKDITFEMLLRNLDKVLRLLPEDATKAAEESAVNVDDSSATTVDLSELTPLAPRRFDDEHGETGRSLSDQARNFGATTPNVAAQDDCIICFDSSIDCVATPCGHQVCCLKCSEHISRCPVCSSDCTFMRVFKP